MADPATCKHSRTRIIAEDRDARYLECLDCGAILEAGEIADELAREKTIEKALEKEGPSGFDESLSDA